ncbi:MAG: ABC transporter ATP-binding protein [Silvanigrellaceae bacterium]|nr:ABC transporter ATP-binding protein [Silvanigrellaceae bacterium]
MLAVEAKNLSKTYKVGEVTLPVLKNISFAVAKGELVGVVGASGSGKSTLLHILGALDTPDEGSLVVVGGVNPFQGTDKNISKFRNKQIGFIFQHNNLLSEFSALENVMMPALIAGISSKKAELKARQLLQAVRLSDRIEHFPSQLSGGEQQRVAIARALVNDPELLLADEPSGNLDSKNAQNIHDMFIELNNKFGTTAIIVTHNKNFAELLPRCLHIKDGEIIPNT